MSAPRIILLANYEPDAQQSMLRFARSLRDATAAQGAEVHLWHPPRRYGPARATHRGLGKWLAYADKYPLAVRALRRLAATEPRGTVFHVCDHSNAPWLAALRGRPHAVTCHDLLALRGALGEPVHCPASATGRVLQSWIRRWLRRATLLFCDSDATRRDAGRLLGFDGDRCVTVYPCLNDAIGSGPPPAYPAPALERLKSRPYVLHVGSSLPRKNRPAVAASAAAANALGWNGGAVFAGDAIDAPVLEVARRAGGNVSVLGVERPAPDLLRALYVHAHALVFPSHSEGFGYPVLEAQTCGCPVICSDTTSVPEIAGPGAFVHAPSDTAGMARSIVALADPLTRARVVAAGTANLARFDAATFARRHIALWTELSSSASL
jgi:glycosyltransferase involved in cell wall biosynthesis